MRHLLQIYDEGADEHSVVFNASKSKCLVVAHKGRRHLLTDGSICPFYVGRNQIEFVDQFVHFGHVINSKLDDCNDISHRRNSFIGQTNNVSCDFSCVVSAVRYKLFKSYCSSIYGCESWCLDDSKINEFCTTWRRGRRRIWNLAYRAHCDMLHALSNDIPV